MMNPRPSFIVYLFSLACAALWCAEAPAAGNSDAPVRIPAGEFQMGTEAGTARERPIHKVWVDAFVIDRLEISNKAYETWQPGHRRSHMSACDECPVTLVTWQEAVAFCQHQAGRLPTEAEWEKAARGNDARLYPWGEKWSKGFVLHFVNVFGMEDQYEFTAPVDYYPSGASPFGVTSMAGNVWEWCLDWYDKDYYRTSPELNPEGPQAAGQKMKVLRGGSWVNSIDGVQVIQRSRNLPTSKKTIYGFRTALPVP